MDGISLKNIHSPADLKGISDEQLKQLADELRAETISAVSQTGGHLGAGLGVVELTIALHSVFNTPKDRLIWDVGHQAYPHKILTGRRERMHTMRQGGGLSGFTKRKESEYDPFGAGHSSTSISAALGMAMARELDGDDSDVGDCIAVIGDGALSAGMAYEALNNAGALQKRLIVILNDNDMSIAPPVGAMSGYLSKLISSTSYVNLRELAKKHLPSYFERAARKTEHYAKSIATGGNWFTEMGFYYIGPIDGHNLDHLLPVLRNVRDQKDTHKRPILIHVVTEKGHGFDSPEASSEKYHAVKKFDLVTKVQEKGKAGPPTYTNIFAQQLMKDAAADEKIVAITAAMPSGTGLDKFASAYPERCFDVGIAEQHAVTFAAGLAAEGYKPFATIYSTFLQRAYDQVVHDVAIQNLPVRFAIDRAGLVGADGATHAGSFDITYLSTLPNMVVMAAADESELVHMTHTAAEYNDGPIAFRYPRGEASGNELPEKAEILEIGKGRIVKTTDKPVIALLSLGTRLGDALNAAEQLEAKGFGVTVADARFAKPIDTDLVERLAKHHSLLITIEEGAIGGFGSHVSEYLTNNDLTANLQLRTLHLPDVYQDQDSAPNMVKEAGLDAEGIVSTALSALKLSSHGGSKRANKA